MLHKLVKLWERTQVELHGSYSSDRLLTLAKYTRDTSWKHLAAVLIITPLPCLVLTVISDVFPLDDPAEGVNANKWFQVRQYFSYFVMSFLSAQQFRTSVRDLPYPNWRVARNTILVAALPVAYLYGFAVVVGFPVPFSIVVAVPAWVTSISISMAVEWAKTIRETPGSGAKVVNVLKVWAIEVLLVVIYPPYYYIFTTLSQTDQMFFSTLLPVIKVIMRNIFTLTAVHLRDEMPEVIIFNSEVFNALFVSYCMQNSPSFETTLVMTAALLTQIAMSLRDVNEAVGRIERAERQLYDAKSSVGGHKLTCLEQADSLLPQSSRNFTSFRGRAATKSQETIIKPIDNTPTITLKEIRQPLAGARIYPTQEVEDIEASKQMMASASLRYVAEVQRLLYLTEFLVLIYYVGAFIPLVFSIYMSVMHQLPNHVYYAQLADLTDDELVETLNKVMFSCLLKILSLVLLCLILHYRLRFSAIHQLAFVLEKQWPGVQTKLCFWVFYVVQASLQHHGFDYTFKFSWLNRDSIANNSTSA